MNESQRCLKNSPGYTGSAKDIMRLAEEDNMREAKEENMIEKRKTT